ncbi:hypothetical protein [Dyella sp.]|uniref:hypothetical protein n=1 Tax=Dyella sp. TaxID=1869338 RepID=UPI002851B1EA|nr:hypothetical protein [Dyella sp.]MDR3444694.1 hypothetical protein [Dyella sp.]
MGLMARVKRWRYVYGWRLRYWWIDTPAGLHARFMLIGFAALGVIGQVVSAAIAAARPVPKDHPHQAIIWFVVWLVIALLAAVASYMLAGKQKAPAAQSADTPTTEDGQSVKRHYGTCWVDDSFLLAWKIVGRDPIKSDGGKK